MTVFAAEFCKMLKYNFTIISRFTPKKQFVHVKILFINSKKGWATVQYRKMYKWGKMLRKQRANF